MNPLVFFDIDNTLIKSSSGHMQALLESIHDVYGIEADIGAFRHHGMTDQEIIIGLLQQYGVDDKIIRTRLKACTQLMPLKYDEIVPSENIIVLDGVLDLLGALAENACVLGLVTGNLEKIARAKLKKIGLERFFEIGGFGSDHADRRDLMKIAIRRAEEKFGIGSFKQTFHFGDAPQDMIAAKDAGVMPIGVTTGIFSAEQLLAAGAKKILPNLKNTQGILRFLLKRE